MVNYSWHIICDAGASPCLRIVKAKSYLKGSLQRDMALDPIKFE